MRLDHAVFVTGALWIGRAVICYVLLGAALVALGRLWAWAERVATRRAWSRITDADIAALIDNPNQEGTPRER